MILDLDQNQPQSLIDWSFANGNRFIIPQNWFNPSITFLRYPDDKEIDREWVITLPRNYSGGNKKDGYRQRNVRQFLQSA